MAKIEISVTDAARNFSDCVNRVRYQDMTFVLLKNGTPVAKLTPFEEPKASTGAELAAALLGVALTDEESKAWGEDLERARASLIRTVDKWES